MCGEVLLTESGIRDGQNEGAVERRLGASAHDRTLARGSVIVDLAAEGGGNCEYTQPGETVTWANQDGFDHNVAGANGAWGSFEILRKEKTASYTFSEPGVYAYVCTVHPGMVGTVVVGTSDVSAESYSMPASCSALAMRRPFSGSSQ